MTTDEIKKTINQKGSIAKELFYTYYDVEKEFMNSNPLIDEYSTDDLHDYLLIYCYNLTRLIMIEISENPSRYADRFKIPQRSIERMRKDLKNMTRLDYPDEISYLAMDAEQTNLDEFINNIDN